MGMIHYDELVVGESVIYGARLVWKEDFKVAPEGVTSEMLTQATLNLYYAFGTAKTEWELSCRHRVKVYMSFGYDRFVDLASMVDEFAKYVCGDCPPASVRKFPGVCRVWRLWKQRGGDLYPLISGKYGHWQPNGQGVIESHDIPTRGRAQGFYGFYSLETLYLQEARRVEIAMGGESCNSLGLTSAIFSDVATASYMKDYTMVIGSFLAYGTLIKAKLGVRAQFAKPEFLMLPNQNQDYALELMTLADKYGMKPVTTEQAEEMESGFLEGKGLDG